jgi:phospholipid/cholesterol/gamma-HCH transport system permease protein
MKINCKKFKNGDKQPETIQEVGEELACIALAPGQATLKAISSFFYFLGDCSMLLLRTFGFILKGSISMRETVYQMSAIGVSSLPIVLITVAFSGAVLSLYLAQLVVKFGMGSYTGAAVGLSVTREIAPVLTAVVVTARSGSAMAAELGSMKVTEQIDALRALAVSPIEYLVVPRLLACMLMLPVLTIFANVIGVVAGYLVAVANGVAGGGFISSVKGFVTVHDVMMGLLKTVFFAAVIAMVGVQQGLGTRGGATGVGKSTTSAVVISIVVIYILNFVLAYIFFGGRTA